MKILAGFAKNSMRHFRTAMRGMREKRPWFLAGKGQEFFPFSIHLLTAFFCVSFISLLLCACGNAPKNGCAACSAKSLRARDGYPGTGRNRKPRKNACAPAGCPCSAALSRTACRHTQWMNTFRSLRPCRPNRQWAARCSSFTNASFSPAAQKPKNSAITRAL